MRTTINRSLTHQESGGSGCKGTAQLDGAYAGNTTLDLTKIFYPLGKAPGSILRSISSARKSSQSPARKRPCVSISAATPEQEGNSLGSKYATNVAQARADLISAAQQAATSAIDCATTVIALTAGQDNVTGIQNTINAVQSASAALAQPSDITGLVPLISTLIGQLLPLPVSPIWDTIGFGFQYANPTITANTLTATKNGAVATIKVSPTNPDCTG